MENQQIIKGFSRLSKEEKLKFAAGLSGNPEAFLEAARKMTHPEPMVQERLEQLTENSVSNYFLPYSISPNFLINGKIFHLPMVTEESSVVAAASWAARFWAENGGFQTRILNVVKNGQIFFTWNGNEKLLYEEMPALENYFRKNTSHITRNMEKRGGGILQIRLKSMQNELYQLQLSFNTADSMGANFINSCLEEMASLLKDFFRQYHPDEPGTIEIIMAILSNYTPECLVEAEVSCSVSDLDAMDNEMSGKQFADKFRLAVDIAREDISRAVTHNKGIMNGADAVLIATGNDFRAAEAGVHAWAAREGKYAGLSYVTISNEEFRFGLRMPLSVGTVGGVTGIHPMAGWSLKILGSPDARTLMQIVAAAGLANNFSAVKSLITKGIQKGHMKMHLSNILNMLNADKSEISKALEHFKDKTVSYSRVNEFIKELRT